MNIKLFTNIIKQFRDSKFRLIHYGTRKLRTPVEFLKTERKI